MSSKAVEAFHRNMRLEQALVLTFAYWIDYILLIGSLKPARVGTYEKEALFV